MADQKVLIVEDDPSSLEELRGACEDLGFDVHVSADGLHALMLALRERPDLIVLDADVGGVDAPSVCAALAKDRRLSAVPTIVLIDRTDKQTPNRCEDLGVVFLLKHTGPLGPTLRRLWESSVRIRSPA